MCGVKLHRCIYFSAGCTMSRITTWLKFFVRRPNRPNSWDGLLYGRHSTAAMINEAVNCSRLILAAMHFLRTMIITSPNMFPCMVNAKYRCRYSELFSFLEIHLLQSRKKWWIPPISWFTFWSVQPKPLWLGRRLVPHFKALIFSSLELQGTEYQGFKMRY